MPSVPWASRRTALRKARGFSHKLGRGQLKWTKETRGHAFNSAPVSISYAVQECVVWKHREVKKNNFYYLREISNLRGSRRHL